MMLLVGGHVTVSDQNPDAEGCHQNGENEGTFDVRPEFLWIVFPCVRRSSISCVPRSSITCSIIDSELAGHQWNNGGQPQRRGDYENDQSGEVHDFPPR
jgi:hypothetical protein